MNGSDGYYMHKQESQVLYTRGSVYMCYVVYELELLGKVLHE